MNPACSGRTLSLYRLCHNHHPSQITPCVNFPASDSAFTAKTKRPRPRGQTTRTTTDPSSTGKRTIPKKKMKVSLEALRVSQARSILPVMAQRGQVTKVWCFLCYRHVNLSLNQMVRQPLSKILLNGVTIMPSWFEAPERSATVVIFFRSVGRQAGAEGLVGGQAVAKTR